MKFQWDSGKAKTNISKHGVPFESVTEFDFTSAMIEVDDRRDYGEERLVAVGFIGPRVVVLVYTERGDAVRVISLRKANEKEIGRYVDYIQKA